MEFGFITAQKCRIVYKVYININKWKNSKSLPVLVVIIKWWSPVPSNFGTRSVMTWLRIHLFTYMSGSECTIFRATSMVVTEASTCPVETFLSILLVIRIVSKNRTVFSVNQKNTVSTIEFSIKEHLAEVLVIHFCNICLWYIFHIDVKYNVNDRPLY